MIQEYIEPNLILDKNLSPDPETNAVADPSHNYLAYLHTLPNVLL